MQTVLLVFFVITVLSLNYYWNFSSSPPLKVLGCLRTKDSEKYMPEFFNYHRSRGITHFEVYDDSVKAMKLNEPWITYHYVNGKKLKNEQDDIEKCFQNAIKSKNYDYVMNLDDDEYLFSNSLFKEFDARCMYFPIVYFGTIKSYKTGITPIDYVHRDKAVSPTNKHFIKNGAYGVSHKYYYHPNIHTHNVKKRRTKVIYRIPKTESENFRLIRDLSLNKIGGSYIHGNGMACELDDYSFIAHYTRSEADLKIRIDEFWKTVKGLSSRFSNEEKVNRYIKERNRTEMIDMRMHQMATKVFF